MPPLTSPTHLILEENRPLRLLGARDVEIRCVTGAIWITEFNEPEDIFLKAGQSHRVRNNRLALVEALGNARVAFQEPGNHPIATWAARLGQKLTHSAKPSAPALRP